MNDRLHHMWLLTLLWIGLVASGTVTYTDPNDVAVLRSFESGLENAELLKWPSVNESNDPCGGNWQHVYCSGNRVTQIQVQSMGLKGPLPSDFNKLTKLYNLGMQGNRFNGSLPTFKGLSELVFSYLNNNEFDAIPADFFNGLNSLQVLALDNNPLNGSVGWRIPNEIQGCKDLVNVSMMKCGLVGEVPEFFGGFKSLMELKLSNNRLVGGIPNSFQSSLMQILWLNGQEGGLSGSIEVIGSMTYLRQIWLHNNQFTGAIPDIGNLTLLKELNLNSNQLVGVIPPSLASLDLDKLDVSNNQLMGPIPNLKHGNVTYDKNHFCQSDPGSNCSSDVTALLGFLAAVNYPSSLVSQWSGNNPCALPWVGISCNAQSKIIKITLPNQKLNGTLSPSLSKFDSLLEIKLGGNNLSGLVPESLTGLKSLTLLDLTDNNFEPPLPKFGTNVRVVFDGNPKLKNVIAISPQPSTDVIVPPVEQPQIAPNVNLPDVKAPSSTVSVSKEVTKTDHKSSNLIIIGAVVAGGILICMLVIGVVWLKCKRKRSNTEVPISNLLQPIYPSDYRSAARCSSGTMDSSGDGSGFFHSCAVDSENVISVEILRKVTNKFAPENELGRGGFGVVYKGMLDDGTYLAIKRMESGVLSNKAIDEFQSEICVLSKVRHRHLVSLLGYSIDGNERLLVYEYMPQGALSRHLFCWESLRLKPLSWAKRLVIALDVARGVEYLHGLARESFIHRDLKSSNILLNDDFRAKVSDFGLVKLVPDYGKSIATRIAGTFGYLAPEYAVMGKITTKSDVFSFGVVLVELLTGLRAVDENRSEETRYLAEWFTNIKSNKEKLMEAIDKTLDIETDDSVVENICTVAELAGYCTERNPNHRPDMGYVVNVLAPLVEKWQPVKHELEVSAGINLDITLSEMVRGWQHNGTRDMSLNTSDSSSEGSLPSRPIGFADSFESLYGR